MQFREKIAGCQRRGGLKPMGEAGEQPMGLEAMAPNHIVVILANQPMEPTARGGGQASQIMFAHSTTCRLRSARVHAARGVPPSVQSCVTPWKT
jgi:hypothetical protein